MKMLKEYARGILYALSYLETSRRGQWEIITEETEVLHEGIDSSHQSLELLH